MANSNKLLVMVDEGSFAVAMSNKIDGYTDIQGGAIISGIMSNKLRHLHLRSFVPESRIRAKSINVVDPIPAPVFTVAGAPDPTGLLGHYIYVLDAVGGPVLAYSDGATWRTWTDGSEI